LEKSCLQLVIAAGGFGIVTSLFKMVVDVF